MAANPEHNWMSDEVAAGAVGYLVRLGPPPEALPVLTRAVKQYHHDTRNTPLIARALGQRGPTAKSALPALREAARSSNVPLRRAATEAIERITAKE